MKQKELFEKVELLRAGQVVEIDGNRFQAKQLHDLRGFSECAQCSVDCICTGNVYAACLSLGTLTRPHWLLEIVDGKN